MTTYQISTEHSASSYGEPVLLDQCGQPHGPADVGLWGLPANMCGRVDVADGGTYWSGYGETPNRMWLALLDAWRASGMSYVTICDAGRAVVHDRGYSARVDKYTGLLV